VLCYVYCTDNGCFSLAVVKRNHIELNDYRRNNNSEKNSIQIEWQPLVSSLQSHEQHLQTVLKNLVQMDTRRYDIWEQILWGLVTLTN
jgi:hypothetical protein